MTFTLCMLVHINQSQSTIPVKDSCEAQNIVLRLAILVSTSTNQSSLQLICLASGEKRVTDLLLNKSIAALLIIKYPLLFKIKNKTNCNCARLQAENIHNISW